MSRASSREREIDRTEILAIVERARSSLSCEEYATLKAFTELNLWLLSELEAKKTTLAKLRREVFGPSTEKTGTVFPEQNSEESPSAQSRDEGEAARGGSERRAGGKPKPKGHGRNGADDYPGATRVYTPHATLEHGSACPKCHRGKTYRMKRPAVRIRVTGGAPIQATLFEQERLRCNACGEVFTARPPSEVGVERYDERASAMIAMLHYGAGLPFHRLDRLQRSLGIPLPSSTQWEVVESAADDMFVVYEELIRQCAGAQLFHNDDTRMPVLSLMGKRRSKEAPADDPPERTGMFTTGIVAAGQGFRAAIFCTGRRHAGENLQAVLDRRAAELVPPMLMCDGLDRNLPATTKVELANCLSHGRRYYVDVADNFPDECRHVLTELAKVFRNDAVTRRDRMTDTQRLAYHQEHSSPVMDELETWMDEMVEQRKVEPNSGLGRAFEYMRKRWKKLTRFLEVPGAPLTNNIVERALKRAIVHRKNSLFYRSLKGARVGDAFMSLIYSAEMAGVDPFLYLVALQTHRLEVAEQPSAWMPWNYQAALAACEKHASQ